ncbi:MAG: hypothetical protein ACTHN5_21610 [Phycisphaerae bacterium]
MILYGDPSETTTVGDLLVRIRTHLARPLTADTARSILILAGQLEQTSADDQHADITPTLTDAAADLFFHIVRPPPPSAKAPAESARVLEILLPFLQPFATRTIHPKTPEGLAFYTLYPEQYLLAADEWAMQHPAASRTLVLGIRSIGTSLSAVVLSTLRARGLQAIRITARPAGHPYDRQLSLRDELAGAFTHALIVDEGPSRSGSSFYAASRALSRIGIPLENQTILPGHNSPPGDAASPALQKWYAAANRIVSSCERVLLHQLKQKTAKLLKADTNALTHDDLSAGKWRQMLRTSAPAWPPFERTKWKLTAPDGRAILWKFAGLTHIPESVTPAPFTLPTLSCHAGFRATEWIDATPLSAHDSTPEVLTHLAASLNHTPAASFPEEQARTHLFRLAEMLLQNTEESLGPDARHSMHAVTEKLTPRLLVERRPSHDGRLSPWEWLRNSTGRIIKTDDRSHANDHTIIGPQSRCWDLASAIIDWNLPSTAIARLEERAHFPDPQVTRWYAAAYAAFRLAMSAMSNVDPAPYAQQLKSFLHALEGGSAK